MLVVDGKHSGKTTNVWTYYGEMNYNYKELYQIVDSNGNSIEVISDLESEEPTTIINPNDWVISLFEFVSWGNENEVGLGRKTVLYVYCPENYYEGDY